MTIGIPMGLTPTHTIYDFLNLNYQNHGKVIKEAILRTAHLQFSLHMRLSSSNIFE